MGYDGERSHFRMIPTFAPCQLIRAHGDFGYLSPDSTGKLTYTSLLPFLDPADRDFVDVWTNFVTDEGVYFQTNYKIFKWYEDTIRVWRAKMGDNSSSPPSHFSLDFSLGMWYE